LITRASKASKKGYEKYLTAKEGSAYVGRDAKGNSLSEGSKQDIRGNDIVLTIDEGLQYILEKKPRCGHEQMEGVSATAIMMDPYTGEILALANRPNFDPGNCSRQSVRDPKPCYHGLL